jgi:phytanoyl-CoA hydroxylase
VRSIIGRELRSISSNVFNKPPGVDGRFPLHQDLRYFTLRPAGKIVATWTAITQTTRDNGCLAVVPGSHHHGLREHLDPDWEHVNRGYFAAAGGSNRTSGFRRAISTHFASSECVRPEGPRKRRAVIKDVE